MGFFHPEYFRDTPDSVTWARDPGWPIGTITAIAVEGTGDLWGAGHVSAEISGETSAIYGPSDGLVAAVDVCSQCEILGAGMVEAVDFDDGVAVVCPNSGIITATMHDIDMGETKADLLNIGTIEAVDAGCQSRIIGAPGGAGIVAGTFGMEEAEILGWDSSPGMVAATMTMEYELDVYVLMKSLLEDDALQFVR
jgi:hypothetical protein